MPQERKPIADLSDEEIGALPESFQIEFLSTDVLRGALSQLNAVFRGSEPLGDNQVIVTGERDDGTVVKIEVTRGPHYRSPQEITRVMRDEAREAMRRKPF